MVVVDMCIHTYIYIYNYIYIIICIYIYIHFDYLVPVLSNVAVYAFA